MRRGAPGFTATKMAGKVALRVMQNADLTFNDVFVPDADRLPGANSFEDTKKVGEVAEEGKG